MTENRVMAVFAHSDDVEFQAGATLLKYHERFGYEVIYVESTNNMSGGWITKKGSPVPPPGTYAHQVKEALPGEFKHIVPWFIEMPQRKKESIDAARFFFHTEPIWLDYPQRHYLDGALNLVEMGYGTPRPDCVPEGMPTVVTAHDSPAEVEKVMQLILEKDPEVILTHAPVDYTEEHTATSHLVRKAFIEAEKKGYDGSLVFTQPIDAVENYGEFFGACDTFVDVTGFAGKKRDAIGRHYSQITEVSRIPPWEKNNGKTVGVEEAELFYTFRISASGHGALTEELRGNYRKIKYEGHLY